VQSFGSTSSLSEGEGVGGEDKLYKEEAKDQDKIRNAIRQALDHAKCDFIKHMKDGLETQIGERWVKLSGWEKQRLAIARIFFKNPHILIFDEPTAALDSISEHHITNTLHELFANKTVIVIAHRLQTVMNADQIIVLDDWKIVQSGRHEELLWQHGLYKELVDLQSGVVKEG
jgi:ABC-type multidrug transport system fused ATPase/permease subunit